ncbi:MAG: type II toxin-antitoxin system VapC family toxin [Isosphaeraceae bacterium]
MINDPSPRPTLYVIDTSVALSWYIPQSHPTEALRYLDDDVERHAPDLLALEASHALLKRVRSVSDPLRHLPRSEADAVRALVEAAPIVLHPSLALNALAFALAVEIGASHYDGLFLALAIRLGGQVVTADRKFLDKIRASAYASHARWVAEVP